MHVYFVLYFVLCTLTMIGRPRRWYWTCAMSPTTATSNQSARPPLPQTKVRAPHSRTRLRNARALAPACHTCTLLEPFPHSPTPPATAYLRASPVPPQPTFVPLSTVYREYRTPGFRERQPGRVYLDWDARLAPLITIACQLTETRRTIVATVVLQAALKI